MWCGALRQFPQIGFRFLHHEKTGKQSQPQGQGAQNGELIEEQNRRSIVKPEAETFTWNLIPGIYEA